LATEGSIEVGVVSEKTHSWLLTCGIGCGLILVIVAALGVGGILYVKSSFRSVGEAEESHLEVVRAFGDIADFTPRSDGSVPSDRIETFLTVRESLRGTRSGIEERFADLSSGDTLEREPSSVGEVVSLLGGFVGLINPVAAYVAERNRALQSEGMGLGEYLYIYFLSYYSWLGHSPEDGPVVHGAGSSDRGERILDGVDSTFGSAKVRRRYRRYMLSMLRNQLEAVSRSAEVPLDPDWQGKLERELGAFESHPKRVVWQDGLPRAIADRFEPYRSRFRDSYHSTTNCFELPLANSEAWSR
jgi:hypothetical protein